MVMVVVMKMALPWLVRMGVMLMCLTAVCAIGVVVMGMDDV